MNTLRFEANIVNGEPRITAKERNPAKEIKAGSAVVQIFGRGPYSIAWRESAGGTRKMAMRTKWARAKSFAEQKAIEIANGQTAMSQFTEADRASYKRALELLAPTGQALELAVGIYTEAVQKLQGTSLLDAVQFFLEHRPKSEPQSLPKLIEQFLAERKPEITKGWYTALSNPLNKLGRHFSGPLHAFHSGLINKWLAELKDKKGKPLGSRTRKNYRAALEALVRWAHANYHLSRAWKELDHVRRPKKQSIEIKTLAPDQCARLLAARLKVEQSGRAQKSLVPFLALQMFAGIRHEEMHGEKAMLDWKDVHLDKRLCIYVRKDVSKTGRNRRVPISDNLLAWLTPYAKLKGPVVTLSQVSGALTKAKKAAGIPFGKNETRNVLRKTWISNRVAITTNIAQVADEAGNSVGIIREHYNNPPPVDQARQHFDIWPPKPETPTAVQLTLAGV